MKICAAQYRPVAGDIAQNVSRHLEFIDRSVTLGADLVFFPELSLTGYEPMLAKSLSSSADDRRLDTFQRWSDAHAIVIGVGLPIAIRTEVQIGMIWFLPESRRQIYAKRTLHADETPYFVAGRKQIVLSVAGRKLAPAICFESLQMDHADAAALLAAEIYLVSVAKPSSNLIKALRHYSAVASRHKMFVIMANCIGLSDDFISVGRSAAWNDQGELLAQMDSDSEGLVLLDITTKVAVLHELGD